MVSLYLAENLGIALERTLADFFEKLAQSEDIPALPVGILLPSYAHIGALKVQLSGARLLLNVQFFTPKTLREFLSSTLSKNIACEKDLFFATTLTGLSTEEALFWQPILETAIQAGPSQAVKEAELIQTTLEKSTQILETVGLLHPLTHDRTLWNETLIKLQSNQALEPRFHHFFIAGFGYEDTHLFPLFLQALSQSINASVFLDAVQDLPAQELWVNTWEKFLHQEGRWLPSENSVPPFTGIHSCRIKDTLEIIYRKIYAWENVHPSSRLAITSPCAKTLREVTAFLESHAIPCSATLPLQNPYLPLFKSWRRYQEEETLDATLHFAQTLFNHQKIEAKDFNALSHELQKTAHTLQTHHLSILRETLKHHDCLSFFEDWPILPQEETFVYWDEAATEALQLLGAEATSTPLKPWHNGLQKISKKAILEYLEHAYNCTLETQHPWARLWIGPVEAVSFMKAEEVICLVAKNSTPPHAPQNDWIEDHNKEVSIPLHTGATEKFLHIPFSYILGPEEETLAKKRPLESLMKKGVPVTFIGDLKLLPDEIFEKLEVLSDSIENTIPDKNNLPDAQKNQIQKAYNARRTPHTPFGPYEFTCTPQDGLLLSSSAWEEAFHYPALAFYKHVLHIQNTPVSILQAGNREKGVWVHSWLQEDLGALEASAKNFYEKSYTLPPNILYQALWEEARAHALQIETTFQSHFAHLHRYSEIDLPKVLTLELNDHPQNTLKIKGRIDALLSTQVLDKIEAVKEPIWIIDFKTSPRKPLTINNLKQGYALQLLLYGLALKKLGATAVTLALVSPEGTRPLLIEDWEEFQPLLEELLPISQGQFGEMPFPSFGNAKSYHPTATLLIDPKILATKYRQKIS